METTIDVRRAYFDALDAVERHEGRCDNRRNCQGCDRLAQKLNQAYAEFRKTV